MNFECLQENFNKGLLIVGHLVGRNTTLPILNNILLRTKEGVLELISTNLEMGIKTKIRGKVEKEGSYTVPAQLLVNYINLLPNEILKIEKIESTLQIKGKKYETKIKGIEAEEFPLIPEIKEEKKFQIKNENLKEGIKKVLSSVKENEIRPEISGVLFDFQTKEKELILVGTDSYRLTEKKVIFKKNEKDKKVIVPIKTLQELLRILELEQEERIIEINISENQILFRINETELISRLISGQYPDYKKIIPQEIKTKAITSRDDFVKIVKSVGLFSQTEINDIYLKINPQENKMMISSMSDRKGESTFQLEADLFGEENNIVFNWRYLLDGLNNIDSSEVVLEIVNKDNPALLKSLDDKSYLYLIMPIKE